MAPNSPRIAIVGAGFGGIGMAIGLQRAGFHDFRVFERGDRVGGVWRENTYPGAGCDIASPLYSFSFAPNRRWPRRFSLQESILAYLERCVADFGVGDRISLGTEVTDARFDVERGRWSLSVAGREEEYDVLVCACGQLSEPTTPRFPGAERFRGHSFHSAQWDHEHDLSGERVAVIGTGASAIQFVPEIAPVVEQLHLFQRSAPYVFPKPDQAFGEGRPALAGRVPALLSAERLGWYLLCELGQIGIADHKYLLDPFAALARWYLRHKITDPTKRALLEPDGELGCKRLLLSSDYYPALARENVEIIGEGVASIDADGVVTASGVRREVDTIIYATGFAAQGFVAPMRITGREERRLEEDAWNGGASAYLGITVPDFPNLFLLYGPNTNLGVGSIVHMLESQVRYVVGAVQEIAARPGATFSVRSGQAKLWDAELQRRLAASAWSSGCHSWYVDDNGRNSNNWPGTMSEYRWRTREFKPVDYEVPGVPAAADHTEGIPA